VYFIKKDSAIGDAKWTMGMVEKANKGRDGVIREVVIKYCNASEQTLSLTRGNAKRHSMYPRYTESAVRKLIKILSIEETSLRLMTWLNSVGR
jgi:hypothetical protein